jgi:hypothetical protein
MTTLKTLVLATALVLPLAAEANPAPVNPDGSLMFTLACNAKDEGARGDEVKDIDLTVGVLKTAPPSAFLMFSPTKGDKATSTQWVPAKDGGVLHFTYEVKTFKIAGLTALPSGQFTYFLTDSATHHVSQFTGRCSMVSTDGSLLN